MGRYTSVQAYADNNPSMRAVSYDQATGAAASASASEAAPSNRGPVQPEKVDNPYGSTAGAGSGEFHVYRHARAREMARWKKINEDEAEMKAEDEFQSKMAQDTQAEAEKTEKRRRKRERAKEAKRRKKNMKLGGVGGDVNDAAVGGDSADDEFDYTPIAAAELSTETVTSDMKEDATKDEEKKPSSEQGSTLQFANDGSFLEQMKKQMKKQMANNSTTT